MEITPETYEKMNEEFIEEGYAFIINVPTQEQIDKWKEESLGTHIELPEGRDLVAEMIQKHKEEN